MEPYQDIKGAIEATVFLSSRSGLPMIGGNERDKIDWIFDFRALLLQPRWLNRYAEIFWEKYASAYPFQVSGMETAAISVVAAIVMKGVERGTPVNGVYIRKSRKRHGLLKQIEGTLTREKVILVDDLINSGSTFNKQIKILTDAGAAVSGIFALVAYREKHVYDYLGVPVETIFTLDDFGMPVKKTLEQEPLIDAFETLWRFTPPHPLRNIVHEKSAPLLDEARVYFGTDTGRFIALDQSTGAIDWEFKIPAPIFSSPLSHADAVYFGGNDGAMYALEKKTGAVCWKYAAADMIDSSPACAPLPGLIFAGLEFELSGKQGGIIALAAGTGKKVWSADLPGSTHSSPLYIERDNIVVIGDGAGNVCGYEAETGVMRFHFVARSGVFGGFAYDEKRRTVYFGSLNGTCYGLFVPTGEAIFAREAAFSINATPLISNDVLYFSSLDKKLYAVDLESGNDKWRFATQGRIFGPPVMAEHSVWIGSNDGKLYELDPETGALRSTMQLSERIVNAFAYDEKSRRFFVPTQANELYCLMRAKDPKHPPDSLDVI